jgi:hypothetical protein
MEESANTANNGHQQSGAISNSDQSLIGHIKTVPTSLAIFELNHIE